MSDEGYRELVESKSAPTTPGPWSPDRERWKRHEAAWKQHCSWSHGLWCHCHDWTRHLKKETRECGSGTESGEDPAVSFDLVDDAAMLAAAGDAEPGAAGGGGVEVPKGPAPTLTTHAIRDLNQYKSQTQPPPLETSYTPGMWMLPELYQPQNSNNSWKDLVTGNRNRNRDPPRPSYLRERRRRSSTTTARRPRAMTSTPETPRKRRRTTRTRAGFERALTSLLEGLGVSEDSDSSSERDCWPF
ncbi:unnamed protein product [Torque teno canis virus]|uniref:Uncharacterized ORF2 protein n=3 Tax=Torque teno canis virus TaxID=687385 RepID=ORF3_TTVT1|nr:hypothetical protein TTcaV_gp1 [Torque teno canis virus]Q8QVL8.1 RecName: Full=Uncharacterized ORF2 protein [Torque teno canis virus (isolate Cf-TTV10)]BAB90849.1 unnamed protein product [Torque teno canis virus]